jgi:hypothetical protein
MEGKRHAAREPGLRKLLLFTVTSIKRILAYFLTICSDMQQAAQLLIKTAL